MPNNSNLSRSVFLWLELKQLVCFQSSKNQMVIFINCLVIILGNISLLMLSHWYNQTRKNESELMITLPDGFLVQLYLNCDEYITLLEWVITYTAARSDGMLLSQIGSTSSGRSYDVASMFPGRFVSKLKLNTVKTLSVALK